MKRISKKKIAVVILLVAIFVCTMFVNWTYVPDYEADVQVTINVTAEDVDQLAVLYSTNDTFTDVSMFDEGTLQLCDIVDGISTVYIPSDATYLEIRFIEQTDFRLSDIEFEYDNTEKSLGVNELIDVEGYSQVPSYYLADNVINGTCMQNGNLVWNISGLDLAEVVQNGMWKYTLGLHILLTFILFALAIFVTQSKRILEMPIEIYDNRKLIFDLAKNDFKARFSNSYFGIFWAFVQPVVTVAIYVFVFQVGFKAAPTTTGYPFLLYLIGGICPWFFFSEAWMGATNCFTEYNYLVKKMRFKISILPIVKIISSLFVHFFFIAIAWMIFIVDGKMPGITMIQIVYYMFALICLELALSYFTAAITPFFPDAYQIINILLQVGMWCTPIMYDEAIMPDTVAKVLRCNPLYYIVSGYRDAFTNGGWFWDKPGLGMLYWFVVIVLFAIGFGTFKRLRVHFADVL